MFCSLQGDFSFEKKKAIFHRTKSNFTKKKPKKLLHIFSKEKEKDFSFSKHKSIRTNQKQKKKFFFFSILLLKQHSSLTRGYSLIFQAKNTIKTVNTLWRENQYCINISFLLLSLLFLIILFNFLLIQFIFIFIDYFIY